MPTIRLATRPSPLALVQCQAVATALAQHGWATQVVPFSTMGDEITDRPLHEIGGKEVFIKALQQAILDGKADVAVHSLKDMAATPTPHFTLAAVGFTQDRRDAFISKAGSLATLPNGAIVGTSSPRRAAILQHHYPHLSVTPVRGNLQTRLNKLNNGSCDALILAAAGLARLGLSDKIRSYLPVEQFIPAAGQGIIALECLSHNAPILAQLQPLNDTIAMQQATAERAFAAAMQADCTTALGAHATHRPDGQIQLQVFYLDDNGNYLTATAHGSDPQQVGRQAAQQLQR